MFIGSSKNSKRGLNLKKLGYYGRIVVKWLRMLGIWWEGGGGEPGLASIKEKIKFCGEELQAWGSSKSEPNDVAIKTLQN